MAALDRAGCHRAGCGRARRIHDRPAPGRASVGAHRPCPDAPTERVAAARDRNPRLSPRIWRRQPWFRLDPVAACRRVPSRGGRLVIGRFWVGSPTPGHSTSPAELFAAGPFGGTVLSPSDDGSDLTPRDGRHRPPTARGWSARNGTSSGGRRSTQSATAIYEMRVDRRTRADLGIGAVPLMGGTPPVRPVLDPIVPDARFGRTFSTEFMWDLDGVRLAVQSCGEFACRTRVLTPAAVPTASIGPIWACSSASMALRRDLRGLSRPSLPRRLDRPRDGWAAHPADAAGAPPSSRPTTARTWSTR